MFLVAALGVVGCGRTHTVPPYPFEVLMDGSMDGSMDAARQPMDASDEDGAVDERPVRPSRGLPRNIIAIMGDGMGPEQLATGRFAAGGRLRIDAMAGPALVNTDSLTTLRVAGLDPPATDSAAAATAFAAGVLVENGVLSQTPDGQPLETVLEVCKRAGKATGIVTTSAFFDASPAAFTSHQPGRGRYVEIAREILGVTQPDVVMGAGGWLVDASDNDVDEVAVQAGYFVVRNATELLAWDPITQPRILGLFETDFVPATTASESFTMTPELVRNASSPDPSLLTMTRRAIERLSQDPDGFFLFAEDEIFDELGHRGPAEVAWANMAYPQQVAGLDATVAMAIDWVLENSSFDETLIVVFADHETGGYHFDHEVGPASGTFSGAGDNGLFRFGFHTRTPIAVYALGPGSDSIANVRSHLDTHRLMLGNLP